MSESIRAWTKKVRELFPFTSGRVVDIGSLNVNGTVKDLFPDAEEYIGIDFRDGPDVDVVLNGNEVFPRYDEDYFQTIICMNMLEHDKYFWETLDGINHVLAPGGHLLVAMPTFTFPIHEHPQDYWRAGEDAFRDVIFEHCDILNMETVFTKEHEGKPINPILCAIGKKRRLW